MSSVRFGSCRILLEKRLYSYSALGAIAAAVGMLVTWTLPKVGVPFNAPYKGLLPPRHDSQDNHGATLNTVNREPFPSTPSLWLFLQSEVAVSNLMLARRAKS